MIFKNYRFLMNKDVQQPLEDKLYKALNAPETITDEEREAWGGDPEFMESLQAMLHARRAMMDDSNGSDAHEAFSNFAAQHQVAPARRISLWWKAAVAVAAACLAGWWILPKLTAKDSEAADSNTIYHATATGDEGITVTEAGNVIIDKKQARRQKDGMRNIIVNGDTIIYQPLDISKYQVRESTIKVAQGHTAMLVLSDGTKVWLNTQSSLIYPNAFAANQPRQVQLKGEAYFEVAPDAKRPFIVDCGQLQTTVLGTGFNVRNYADSEPCITLEHGSVQVSGHSQQVVLEPHQQVTLANGNRLKVATADMESALCWRDGLFFFDGKTLREVLIEMGRWYNMDIVVNDHTHLNDRLHFRGERCWELRELVESINIICDVNLSIEGQQLVLE